MKDPKQFKKQFKIILKIKLLTARECKVQCPGTVLACWAGKGEGGQITLFVATGRDFIATVNSLFWTLRSS